MKTYIKKLALVALIFGVIQSCTVEEFSDLNNPEVDAFSESLTRGDLQDLIGGVLFSSRAGLGTYYDDVAVVGREYYRFSSSDPRFTTDLLGGDASVLDNNTFYITTPWGARYRTVKNANIILDILDAQSGSNLFTAQEIDATRGYLRTWIANELLLNLNLTYEEGIRLDVADENNLGPFVSRTEALAGIRNILDQGAMELQNGGGDFPFRLTSGYDGFDTPATFRQVNRGLAARVAAYQEDFTGVLSLLGESFMNMDGSAASLNTGLYHVFSEAPTDLINPLFFALNSSSAGVRVAQPLFLTEAEAGDTRLSKIALRDEAITFAELTGTHDFFLYTDREAPLSVIRNEELILLAAEANINTNPTAAVAALDLIRMSAGLPAYAGATDQASLIQEMLNQRRYSLYGEGHRWVDIRRYDMLNTLPIDRVERQDADGNTIQADDVWMNFPIPLTENQ